MAIYQIVVKARATDTTEFRNVTHYEKSDGVADLPTIQEAVDYLDGRYKARLQSLFHNSITVYGYDVRRVDVGDLPTFDLVPTAGPWAGTNGADSMPFQVAALVTWKANAPYPRSTRSYLFPFGEGYNAPGGKLAAGAITNIGLFAAEVMELDIAAGIDWDKVAVQYGGDPRVVTDQNEVETWEVTNVWATMRSRRPGYGI